MADLNDSLSIIVPVRNAEASLAVHLERLLELLPDLTARFEIVVVDDASTDHTVELVRDLAREYPQVRLIRHNQFKGKESAAKTGLQWAQGETVFVQEDPSAASPADLRRLWSLRHDAGVVMARAARHPGVFEPALLERLSTWGQALQKLAGSASASSIQMIRREALEDLAAETSATQHARADEAHPDQPAGPRYGAAFLRHLRDLALGE